MDDTAIYQPPAPDPEPVTVLRQYGNFVLVQFQSGRISYVREDHLTLKEEK